MMMALDFHAGVLHRQRHLAAQVLIVVGRRDWEVAFLVAGTIAEIALGSAGVPAALFGVNEIVAFVLILVEAHVVENEEFSFGAEVGGIRHARRGEIHLGLPCNIARIAIIALL